MALDLAFNPPQFNEATYDPVKMRQLVDELERLHAALTAETGEGVEPVTSVFGRGGDVVAIQADYDAFFLTPAEGNAAYATLGHLHDGIADTNLVDKTADETVSGMWTFTHVPTSSIDGSILLSHVGNPILGFHETGAAADNGVWNIVAFQESMRFRTSNDAGAADVNWLQVDRTGTTPTTIAFTGAVTGTSFGGITEANLLDKTAAETISGTYTFTAINNISSTTPFLNFTETGVTGVPVWWLGGDGGNFSLRLDNAAPYAWQVNTNAGNDTVTSVSIPTALSVVGAMTAGSYGGITEANLLDKSVAETITGAWTHTAALVINNTLPIFDLNESDGSLDNKRWRFAAQGEQLLLQAVNDAQSVGTSFLTVDRTGTTIDGVAILAPLTATSYDGILPTSWLDKTATETITGAYSFTNSTGVHIANDTGGLLYLTDSDAIANQGKWRFVGADGAFAIQTILDNETSPVAALTIFRTGTTVTAATFGCPLNATSYNGVLQANLQDKTAAETITGTRTYSSANIDLADNILIGAALDDYSILDTDATVSANAVTITYSTSQSYNIDLEAATGNVTITVSGGPPTGNYGEMILRVQQDTTANRTLTWAGGTFIWPGGVEVEPNTGSDAVTIYYLSTWDGGTIWAINGVHYS